MEENIVFDTKDVAKYLEVSVSTIRRRIKEKAIPFYRVGIGSETGPIRFRKSEIDRYVEEQEKRNCRCTETGCVKN